jgi:hypothetical protein
MQLGALLAAPIPFMVYSVQWSSKLHDCALPFSRAASWNMETWNLNEALR